jgi:hypothetical protein
VAGLEVDLEAESEAPAELPFTHGIQAVDAGVDAMHPEIVGVQQIEDFTSTRTVSFNSAAGCRTMSRASFRTTTETPGSGVPERSSAFPFSSPVAASARGPNVRQRAGIHQSLHSRDLAESFYRSVGMVGEARGD